MINVKQISLVAIVIVCAGCSIFPTQSMTQPVVQTNELQQKTTPVITEDKVTPTMLKTDSTETRISIPSSTPNLPETLPDHDLCLSTEISRALPLLFVANWKGSEDIYEVLSDGSNLIRMTTNNRDEIAPQWSPSGDVYAYIDAIGSGNNRISHLNLIQSGITDPTPLIADMFVFPDFAWSPDGTKIAFSAAQGDSTPNLYAISVADGAILNLDQAFETGKLSSSLPQWSPDGTTIVVEAPLDNNLIFWRLFLVNQDGANFREIDSDAIEDRLPRWNHLGDNILFVSKPKVGQTPEQLYQLDIDTLERTQITDTSEFKTLPSWSPDSNIIAYVGYTTIVDSQGKQSIDKSILYLLQNNGNRTILVDSPHRIEKTAWAPDGRQIAFILNEDSGFNLYVVDRCTGVIELIASDVSNYEPNWKPLAR